MKVKTFIQPYSLCQKAIKNKYENKNAGYLKHLFMQMSRCRCQRICHAIRDASRAVMQRCTRKKWAKHVHTSMPTITASFNCLTLRSIETQSCRGSGWYLSRPELVPLSVRLIRQPFIFCPYNRHVISVCWLHYISAWFAWKAPLCFLAVGVVLLLRSSALLYSSWPGKITLRVL